MSLTPACAQRHHHARAHLRNDGTPPPRPTPAMRTRMHEQLDRLLTTGCSWCMAEHLHTLAALLHHLQDSERAREIAHLDHQENAAA